MKKILGITGIRSDYDLMSSLYKSLSSAEDVDFKLLVGGAHLSPTYGNTVDMIKADGIDILLSLETLIDGDRLASRIKTGASMLFGSIDIVASWAPDIIIYAGDREEVWIGGLLGAYLGIPTVHFYGGDHTVTGHVDNPIRHAASKMSTIHFVATNEHRLRLLSMGESEARIKVIGNLSLDNFVSSELVKEEEIENALNSQIPKAPYAMLIFHPDSSERNQAAQYLKNIIEELLTRKITVLMGYPNTDPFNKDLIKIIEGYKNNPLVIAYKNLDRNVFISLYKKASFIIGNSSSGIMEAASIPIPAINVGLRQRGRSADSNVIFCNGDRQSISDAIDIITSDHFIKSIANIKSQYGNGMSTKFALEALLSSNLREVLLKTEDPLKN